MTFISESRRIFFVIVFLQCFYFFLPLAKPCRLFETINRPFRYCFEVASWPICLSLARANDLWGGDIDPSVCFFFFAVDGWLGLRLLNLTRLKHVNPSVQIFIITHNPEYVSKFGAHYRVQYSPLNQKEGTRIFVAWVVSFAE